MARPRFTGSVTRQPPMPEAGVGAAEGVSVIEDCAHTIGPTWRGGKPCSFGPARCFSTVTRKHMNSGEGGLPSLDDAGFMASATMLRAGSVPCARRGAVAALDLGGQA